MHFIGDERLLNLTEFVLDFLPKKPLSGSRIFIKCSVLLIGVAAYMKKNAFYW